MVLIGVVGEASLVNEAFTHLFGYSIEELSATGWNNLIPPEDLEGAKARVRA